MSVFEGSVALAKCCAKAGAWALTFLKSHRFRLYVVKGFRGLGFEV